VTLMKPALSEQNTAWDLRSAWGTRRSVRLTMTERCMVRTIVGRVTRVSVTGAFAVIDGWHVPCDEVLGIGKPTLEDHTAYQREVRRLQAEHQIQGEAA
jgi:hypothetical protein